MAEEGNIQNSKARVDIEARPRLTGTSAFKQSLGDMAGELAEPGIILAAGGTRSQAAWAGLRGILLTHVLGPLGLISGAVIGIGAAIKIVTGQTRLMVDGLREAERMESLVTMFQPLLGGAQAAKQRLAELFQFAETTPFSIKGIAEASRLLEIMTRGALSTSAGLRMIGDAAAIAGQPLEDVSFWVGRLYDGLKSDAPIGEAMMRLQEMGVVSGSVRREVQLLTEAGAGMRSVWAVVEREIKRNEGGMKLLSQTAGGLRSTLLDARDAMARGFGDNFLEREKDSIRNAINVTEAFTPVIAELGEHMAFLMKPGQVLVSTLGQSKAAMETLATAMTAAMRAFLVFGAAAITAQAAVTGHGLANMVKNLGSLKSALKTAIAYKFNFVKASKASAVASRLSASATALEARSQQAATTADAQRLAVLAAKRRSMVATIAGTKGMSMAMAGTTIRGRVLGTMLKGLKGILGLIGGAFRAAFAAMLTGVGAVASVVGVAVTSLYLWHRATKKQKEYLEDLKNAQADTRKEAEKQAGAIRSLQEQLDFEKKLVKDLAAAYDTLREAKEKDKGFFKNKEGVELAEKGVKEAQGRLDEARDKDRKPSEDARKDKIKELAFEQEKADIIYQGELQRAKGSEKALLMAKRQQELEAFAAQAKESLFLYPEDSARVKENLGRVPRLMMEDADFMLRVRDIGAGYEFDFGPYWAWLVDGAEGEFGTPAES